MGLTPTAVTIPATDGHELGGTVFEATHTTGVVVISAAMAVPHRFYRHFAGALAEAGLSTITYDFRGIGASAPDTLRGFATDARTWALVDMPGVVDWARRRHPDVPVSLIGHSFGGQVAGMLEGDIHAMVTVSAQSGHWRLQGGNQRLPVALHGWITLPVLARVVGYAPWSVFGAGEDLPKGVALQWAKWVRDPEYLFGEDDLPLDRYADFTVPTLAYSFEDDDWGTAASVRWFMGHYPDVTYRHVDPTAEGIERIGHMGFFRPEASTLWQEAIDWIRAPR